MIRTCTQCLVEKPLEQFYRHPFAKEGRMPKCTECTKANVRANRNARADYYKAYDRARAGEPHRKAARMAYALKDNRPRPEPNKQKRDARVAVGNAIRDGVLIPSPECEICQYPGDVVAHHDDYSKPLSVIWVCSQCHALVHRYWTALDRKGMD